MLILYQTNYKMLIFFFFFFLCYFEGGKFIRMLHNCMSSWNDIIT